MDIEIDSFIIAKFLKLSQEVVLSLHHLFASLNSNHK